MRHAARIGARLLLTLAVLVPAAARGDEADWSVYVRDVKGIDRAVDILGGEARRRGATEIVVAFDALTFAAPPGDNEYRAAHDYASDLPTWFSSLEAWARTAGVPVRAVSTLGPDPSTVGAPGWKDELQGRLAYRWWEDDDFDGFEPAVGWIKRWCPEKGGLLVLLASELTPERWVDPSAFSLQPAHELWRLDLLPVGRYWDEEAIGATLARQHCALVVVAPEVLFGDESPLPVLPALPWAARPQRLIVDPLRLGLPGLPGMPGTGPTTPPSGPPGAPPEPDELRKALDEALKDIYPDPEERRRVVDAMLEEIEKTGGARRTFPNPTTPGGSPPDEEAEFLVGGRFHADTPLWFPHYRGTVVWNDHTPSAFGYWPYARAAAKTGGRYVFYPFPPAPWLDVCPRDGAQLKRLAPELVTLRAFAKARGGDRALDSLCRAERIVFDDTPWMDSSSGRLATGWSAFESLRPKKPTKRYRLRRKPFDLHLMGTARQLKQAGEDLVPVVEQYDQAIRVLDKALARVAAGKDTSHPRSVADLRLGRYWFAMSAFHLEALSIYLREFERFAPPGFDERRDKFVVTYVTTIKMSDCLDAYDGGTLSQADEKRYGRHVTRAWGLVGKGAWNPGDEIPGQQGNVLRIPLGSRNYRAKRDRSNVLRYLDRRLMPRALDMIHAAEEVMKHHAKTPWGWTTYYSEAYTFVFLPLPKSTGTVPRRGEDGEEEDTPPWTPTPRGGGSSPGGPVTK